MNRRRFFKKMGFGVALGVLQLEWFDGTTLVKEEAAGYFVGGLGYDDQWKTISATVSSPENVSKLRVVLYVDNFDAGRYTPAGTCYFDDITVTPIGTTMCAGGDLNEDCHVDLFDVSELSLAWGVKSIMP